MNEIERLFGLLDDDNDGFIDKSSFKRIINILGLPIQNHKIAKKNTYQDLIDYVQTFYEEKRVLIKTTDLKSKLSDKLDTQSIDFLIKEIYGKSTPSTNIDIKNLSEKIDSNTFTNDF